jgi:hypothetical protein
MFFWNEPKTPWWKVVLRREPRNQQVVVNAYDDNIETHGVMYGLEAPLDFPNLKTNRTLVGAIELDREKNLMATQALHSSLGVDDMV